MHRLTALVTLLLLIGCHGARAQSQTDEDSCNKNAPDLRIAACSKLLESPQLSSQNRASALHNRGNAWAEKRNYERAIADYDAALRINPLYAMAYYHRFMAERSRQSAASSIARSTPAPAPRPPSAAPPSSANPKEAAGYNKRGLEWAEKRDYDRAITDYNEALRLDPQYAFAYYNRGNAWNNKGDYRRALTDYNEALRLSPKAAGMHNSVAWLLATAPAAAVRNGARAVELARKAVELTNSQDADILDTLAAAYAEAGVFSEAVRWQEKALAFPEFAKDQGEAARLRLELYRKGQPYHQPAKS